MNSMPGGAIILNIATDPNVAGRRKSGEKGSLLRVPMMYVQISSVRSVVCSKIIKKRMLINRYINFNE